MSPLKHVKSGDPMRIPAPTFNMLIDAGNDFLKRKMSMVGAVGAELPSGPGLILVRNETGGSIDRFAVLQLATSVYNVDTPAISPDDNFEEFARHPIFDAEKPVLPSARSPYSPIVIAQQPALEHGIVPAVISGITPAKVDISDATDDGNGWDHGWADVVDASTDHLISGVGGRVELIWINDPTEEEGGDIVWAIVRLGVRPLRVNVPVIGQITAVDEDTGDPPQDHQYKAETLDGSGREITAFVSPENERCANVRYEPAAVNDLCLMWWDDHRGQNGDGHILAFTEIPVYLSGY